jgi:hypothetical protein
MALWPSGLPIRLYHFHIQNPAIVLSFLFQKQKPLLPSR